MTKSAWMDIGAPTRAKGDTTTPGMERSASPDS